MASAWTHWLRWLSCVLLSLLLVAAVDLSLSEQSGGGVPLFNDVGSVTLPPESVQELQESMPELEVFGRDPDPTLAPPLLDDSARAG